MQHQLAGHKAVGKRGPQCLRLLGALAVTNCVVRVPLERDARKAPRHPRVEGVMQEQVRQEWTYYPTLRCPRSSWHDAAVLHLHRSLQPALDIKQYPRAVRMSTDRLEHQLPIDAVEVPLADRVIE